MPFNFRFVYLNLSYTYTHIFCIHSPISLSLPSSLSPSHCLLPPPNTDSNFNTKKLQDSFAIAMAFAGTTQKCMACDKTVYLVDKLTADNRVYHKACFRCHHCNGTLKVNQISDLLCRFSVIRFQIANWEDYFWWAVVNIKRDLICS